MGNKKGSKKKYNKQKILNLLNNNREGLTAKDIDSKLIIGNTLHIYLARLLNNGLIEWFNLKSNKYKSYRLTDKYFEPERQKEALEILNFLKELMKTSYIIFDIANMPKEAQERLRKYGII